MEIIIKYIITKTKVLVKNLDLWEKFYSLSVYLKGYDLICFLAICPHISNFRKWIVGSTFVIKKRVFKWGNVLTKLNLPLRLEEYYWKLHISLILFNSVLLLYSCGGLDPILPHWLILDHTGIFAVQPSDLSPPSVFPPDTLNVPDAQTIPSQESPKSHIWGLVVACVVIGLVMFISPS